jgi:hypothetical protein
LLRAERTLSVLYRACGMDAATSRRAGPVWTWDPSSLMVDLSE